MNSRQKGKRGERQWRDELRANGYDARRGQQFSGSPDSPDVVCNELRWIHFEVKAVEKLNVQDAMDQARRDAGQKIPVVAHKRNFREWLVTITAEVFFRFLRGDFSPEAERSPIGKQRSPVGEQFGNAVEPQVGLACLPTDNNQEKERKNDEDKR